MFRAWLTRVLLQHLERQASRQAPGSAAPIAAGVADTSALSTHASSSDPELSAALSEHTGMVHSSAASSSMHASFHSSRSGRPIDPALLKPVYPELLSPHSVKQQLEQSLLDVERMEEQQQAAAHTRAHDEEPVRDPARTVRFAPSLNTTRSPASSASTASARSIARVAPAPVSAPAPSPAALPADDPHEVPLDDLMFAHFKRADRRSQLQLERILLRAPVVASATGPAHTERHAAPAATEVPSAHLMAPSDLRDLLALEQQTAVKHEESKEKQPSQQRSAPVIQPAAQKRPVAATSAAPVSIPPPPRARPTLNASSLSLAAFTDLSFSPGSSFGFGSSMPSFDSTAASIINNDGAVAAGQFPARAAGRGVASSMLPLDPTPVTAPVPAVPGGTVESLQVPSELAIDRTALSAIDPFKPPPRPLPRLSFNFSQLSKPAHRR